MPIESGDERVGAWLAGNAAPKSTRGCQGIKNVYLALSTRGRITVYLSFALSFDHTTQELSDNAE